MELAIGTWVGFTAASGNKDTGKDRRITAVEVHRGLTFYRLHTSEAGLFLRSSLYV